MAFHTVVQYPKREGSGMTHEEEQFVGTMMPILDEKQRRLFLGAYSKCLGYGGVKELSILTGVSRTTITQGKEETGGIEPDARAKPSKSETGRTRACGAGRKTIEETHPQIRDELLLLLDGNTVGNPENPLCWTTKSLRNLEDALAAKGLKTNHMTIKQLLEDMGFSLQQNKKYIESGNPGPDRDGQFQYISKKSGEFLEEGLPVISVDTKKKELVGNYKNSGSEYRPNKTPLKVLDHDFPDPELGKAAPYGIYDIGKNEGFVNIGLSADTGAFAVNSIRTWWEAMGKERYPDAGKIYITADGGGSNGRRNRLWKVSLQQLADETGLEIHVSHFPPGTSKWNKIEHRLFSFISKNWRGRPLETVAVIVSLISSTTTDRGLTVQCVVDPNQYERGVKVSDIELNAVNMREDAWHGEWNYTISPNVSTR